MSTSRRLLVIHTGGTIGMVPTDQGWAPGADLRGWLDDLVTAHFPGLTTDFVALEPLIDSSSATPRDWQRIVEVIDARCTPDSGVLVLHGTDTMAYAAAALAWALAGRNLPVVITGSQRSLVAADSDAPHNVRAAIGCLLDERLDQVALCFDDVLIPGHRASKTSSRSDHGFDAVNCAPLAAIDVNDHSHLFLDGSTAMLPALVETPRPYTDADIAIVSFHPGLTAARLRAQLTPAPRFALLRAHGTGNVPDNDPAMADALAQAAASGTLLVVTTQCTDGGVELGHYAASQPLLRAGAVSGGSLGVEGLVALLTFAAAQGWTNAETSAALLRVCHAAPPASDHGRMTQRVHHHH